MADETDHDDGTERERGVRAAAPARRRVRVDVDLDRGVFMISVAAELADMHPQTLRMYEQKGLIEPKRSPKGTRLYSQRDVERLRQIQEMTCEAGLNLAGVERVLELEEQLERARGEAEAQRDRYREAAAALERGRRETDEMRARLTREVRAEVERIRRNEEERVRRAERGEIVPYRRGTEIVPARPLRRRG